MTGLELLERVRLVLRDTVKPYLFSDSAIFSYLTEGQNIFCRKTHVLMDDETFSVETEAGKNIYPVNARIVKVYGAKIDTESIPLYPKSAQQYELAFNSSSGKPTGFANDFGYKYIAFNYVPDAVYTVLLTAAVLPEAGISDVLDPVIPEDYHYLLAHYAVSQLPRHVDADAGSPQTAVDSEQKWYTGLRDAKREIYTHRMGDTVQFPKIT